MFRREITEAMDGQNNKKERNQSDHRANKELLCDLCEEQKARVQHQACKAVGGEAGDPGARGEEITLQVPLKDLSRLGTNETYSEILNTSFLADWCRGAKTQKKHFCRCWKWKILRTGSTQKEEGWAKISLIFRVQWVSVDICEIFAHPSSYPISQL